MNLSKKKCNRCGLTKGKPFFYGDKSKKDGLSTRCRLCIKEARKPYLQSHRAEECARVKAHYEKTRNVRIAYAKKWREENRERSNESARRRKREKGKTPAGDASRAAVANRRAKLRGNWVEDVDRQIVWDRDKGICILCNQKADPFLWHLEHLHPVARGGEHSYANTAVAHPHCNQSKGAQTFEEWKIKLGELSPDVPEPDYRPELP